MRHRKLNIGVDFDGTIAAKAKFPDIGADLGAVPWLQLLHNHPQINLVLYTMREGEALNDAVRWCNHRDIWFHEINEVQEQKKWAGQSRKLHFDILVDDLALGIPLIATGGSAFVDWEKAGPMLMERVGRWLLNHPRAD